MREGERGDEREGVRFVRDGERRCGLGIKGKRKGCCVRDTSYQLR